MTSRVIAHRGLHRDGHAENSPAALEAALRAGFGVELDVWAGPGDYMLLIGHDADATYDLTAAIPALHAGPGPVLWDVKGPGLEHGMRLVQSRHPELWSRSWWFDHDYRGTDPELPQRFPQARYLWRDWLGCPMGREDWDGAWEDNADLPNRDAALAVYPDAAVFYVSPELHRRPISLALWQEWLGAGAHVCTDHPRFAAQVFEAVELQPMEPWWQQ